MPDHFHSAWISAILPMVLSSLKDSPYAHIFCGQSSAYLLRPSKQPLEYLYSPGASPTELHLMDPVAGCGWLWQGWGGCAFLLVQSHRRGGRMRPTMLACFPTSTTTGLHHPVVYIKPHTPTASFAFSSFDGLHQTNECKSIKWREKEKERGREMQGEGFLRTSVCA